VGRLGLGVDQLLAIGRRGDEVGREEAEGPPRESGGAGRVPENGAEVVGDADIRPAHGLGPRAQAVEIEAVRRGDRRQEEHRREGDPDVLLGHG